MLHYLIYITLIFNFDCISIFGLGYSVSVEICHIHQTEMVKLIMKCNLQIMYVANFLSWQILYNT